MGDTYRLGPKHGCVLILMAGLVKLTFVLSGTTAASVLGWIILRDVLWFT